MAYRRIVRRLNPEVLLFSEFTSINGMEHSDVVRSRLNFKTEELPYIVQLFGNEPDLFAKTVQQYQDSGITGIDINMGCPAKKIVKSNCGGSLMRDQDLACRIVEACNKNSVLPVSVKTRLGWNHSQDLVTFVRALVDAGASMITIHGRTYKQGYKGTADWEPIYDLKDKINVPVIGNGDITGHTDGIRRLGNLDGFMIGRASIGNPWVFWTDEMRETVTLKSKIATMIEHFQLLREYKDERSSLIEFRKHVSGYLTGFQNAKSCRIRLMQSQTESEFIEQALAIA